MEVVAETHISFGLEPFLLGIALAVVAVASLVVLYFLFKGIKRR